MQQELNPYLRTKILTAKPEELRGMLLDGAIKFAHQGRSGLEQKNFEMAFDGFSQSRDIILELLNTVNPEHNPELAARTTSLYTYMYSRLIEGSHERDLDKVDEVIGLLEYERETWTQLLERLASDTPVPADRPKPSERPSLSLEA